MDTYSCMSKWSFHIRKKEVNVDVEFSTICARRMRFSLVFCNINELFLRRAIKSHNLHEPTGEKCEHSCNGILMWQTSINSKVAFAYKYIQIREAPDSQQYSFNHTFILCRQRSHCAQLNSHTCSDEATKRAPFIGLTEIDEQALIIKMRAFVWRSRCLPHTPLLYCLNKI